MKDTVLVLLCAVALAHSYDGSTQPCNCDPSEAKQICESHYGLEDVLVAHENCDKFYKCANGKPVVYQCPDNLLYDPVAERCEWPYKVNCGDRPISNGNDCNGTDISSTQASVSSTTSTPKDVVCNCRPEEAPGICAGADSDGFWLPMRTEQSGGKPVALTEIFCLIPKKMLTAVTEPDEAPSICGAEGSDGVLIAHENCNQFYKCDHGKPVALYCNGNLLYNPYTEQCDWPENVDCGDRFYKCDHGKPVALYCNGNLLYNPYTEQCDWPENVDCSGTCNCRPDEAPSICGAEGSDGVLIAHENCNQFYKCDHGKPVALYCNGNLLYNPYTEQCDWPENVDCGDRVIPSPGPTPAPGPSPTQTASPSTPGGGNCNPSEAPTICAADNSEGVLVAHENCNQYYICSGGKPVALSCPGNLLFNPSKDQCDWPENVDCGSGTCNCRPDEAPSICGAEGSDGVLIAHENCNQFYKCDHGKPVALYCNGNLLYNPYTEQCDWPENVDCGGNCNPSEAPTICAADNSEGVLVAHENCNQYYICSGGKPVALNCPGNLLFNPSKDQCDWPENVDCGSGTCNCRPDEAPSICAADGSDGVLVAHENCNQFYKCDHGKPVALYCFGNLLYNPYTEQCDWPENVDCGDRLHMKTAISSTNAIMGNPLLYTASETCYTILTLNNATGPRTLTAETEPDEAPSICAADGSDGVLVAHENCNQFYKCDHGKPVALYCFGNLLYNPYTEQCDWPENVDCGDRAPSICAADGSDGVLVAHENCNQFYKCDHGKPVALYCFGNLLYNPYTEQCDWPENVRLRRQSSGTCNCRPDEAPSICAADGSDGVLVAHENCNQFYKCDHGKPVALYCFGNLLYNPYTEQCDWPENVRLRRQSSGTCNCRPDEAPSICAADGSDGVLVAHENCNQFYKCDHGKPVALYCFGNLLYNPYTEQCDWPENVDCGDRTRRGTFYLCSGWIRWPPTTTSPTSPAPTTTSPTSPAPTTTSPTSPAPTTTSSTSPAPTTPSPTSPAPSTPSPTSLTPDPDSSESSDIDDLPKPDDDVSSPEDCTDRPNDNTCNCDPDQAPSICANANSNGIHIAHENCNQFYKCDNGKPIPFRCPSNLLYNPFIPGCDWPHNVDCGDRIIPDPDDTTEGPQPTVPDDNNDDVGPGPCNHCNPEDAPAICAGENSTGIHIAHQNCNQYYVCEHGRPVTFSCNSLLLYNAYTKQCDWPYNVDCGDRVIPDRDNDSGNDSGDDDNNNNEVHDDPSQAPSICAGSGSDGVLVAHEYCDQYYICDGGFPLPRPCHGGLLFNPQNQQCDWPYNVNCGNRIVPDDCACNPRNAPKLCSWPNSEGKLIAHDNCNQFYVCSNGVPVAQTCPSNLLYNIDLELCDWPHKVSCANRQLSYSSLNKHWQSRQFFRT
ncbi:hypothetical protein HW555_009874 [Spodoptera exigua]|uniref:Chitin-binding type-2 domain-containing protein n=1 Tax=Spodoptera exigua TaxID=7107 RepID=A0A835GA83_SPOEX|nr:hypothetical protein HW555_009874 [Spodoptera exigua]